LAPSREKAKTSARPMPLAPPVTTATRSLKLSTASTAGFQPFLYEGSEFPEVAFQARAHRVELQVNDVQALRDEI
jgi:hypothetical protein